ncbi:MAG: hypothetical protein HQ513_17375 [Rhodospirillales bacterium]|nr:hypothetical protein [Rhodospirillales bacterium]
MAFTHHAGMDAKTNTKQQLIQDLLIALTGGGIAIWASIAVLHSRGHAVEDWQTLLAAIFGVIGLGLAHFLTTSHQHQRDEEIRSKEQDVRDVTRLAEMKAIATALRVEIHFLSQIAPDFVDDIIKLHPTARTKVAKITGNDIALLKFPKPMAYTAYVGRLGLLPHDAVEQTVNFYLYLAEHDRNTEVGHVGPLTISTLERAAETAKDAIAGLNKIIND